MSPTEPDAAVPSTAMTDHDRRTRLARIAEHQRAVAVAMAGHRLDRVLETRLTAGRLHALVVLDTQGPQPAGDLARALGVSAATTTGLVDGLVRDGFVERHADPDDGRSRVIHATPAGVQAWRDAILGPTAIEGDVLSRLSDDELALLERASAVLRRVVTEVTEGDGTAV